MRTPTAQRVHLVAMLYVLMARRTKVDPFLLEWAEFVVRANSRKRHG